VSRKLDDAAVVAAYARWAPVYDSIFGVITNRAIAAAMAEINRLPAGRVLEVGVGTGLALPLYRPAHHVTGIDLSPDMLGRAERRVVAEGLANVEGLVKMDAAALAFADASFDVGVAMFVMSVVPDPGRVLAEMARVVRRGGRVVIVNHFAAAGGLRGEIERRLARCGAVLGWHPEFPIDAVFVRPELKLVAKRRLAPFGLYTLIVFERE